MATMTLEEMDILEYEDRVRNMAERAEELRVLNITTEGLRELYHFHFQEMDREARVYRVPRQRFFDLYLGIVVNGIGNHNGNGKELDL